MPDMSYRESKFRRLWEASWFGRKTTTTMSSSDRGLLPARYDQPAPPHSARRARPALRNGNQHRRIGCPRRPDPAFGHPTSAAARFDRCDVGIEVIGATMIPRASGAGTGTIRFRGSHSAMFTSATATSGNRTEAAGDAFCLTGGKSERVGSTRQDTKGSACGGASALSDRPRKRLPGRKLYVRKHREREQPRRLGVRLGGRRAQRRRAQLPHRQ